MLRLLDDDHELTGIERHTFQYATPLLSAHPLRRIPDLDDIADSLHTFLTHELAGADRIVLVSHSMGGLVIQRMLARTLARGRGPTLAPIRRIVMFACPNAGSDFALLLRRRAWLWKHPQEPALRPLATAVAEAQSAVLNRVVHATAIAADRCPIPIVSYAGESDRVVTPTSARGVFPDTGVLPGDHFTIIQPDSARHRSFGALKHNLLAARASAQARQPTAGTNGPTGPLAIAVQGRLVEALLAVPRMSEPPFRDELYQLLPAELRNQLRRDNAARIELFSLVNNFDSHRSLAPWEALMTALTALVGEHPAVTNLADLLAELGLRRPAQPR